MKKTLMKTTCGGLVYYNGKLLICRPRWDSELWNLPKGIVEKRETLLSAAIREIYEETNIVIDDSCKITDFGGTSYGKKKKLHLFYIVLMKDPGELKCNSFFEVKGKQIPEMVDYKWINPCDYSLYFSDKLTESVRKIFNKGLKNVHRIDKKSGRRNSEDPS